MQPIETQPGESPEPPPKPPAAPPAGLKQLFIGACLLLISPCFCQYGVISLLFAFVFSFAGLLKARRLRFRIYGVLLSIETGVPVAFVVWIYFYHPG